MFLCGLSYSQDPATDPIFYDLYFEDDFIQIDTVTITVYNAVKGQTDDDPLTTATGFKIRNIFNPPRILAVSRDMLDTYPYHSWVNICCDCMYNGLYQVEDTMNKRIKNTVDILISPDEDIGIWRGTIELIK